MRKPSECQWCKRKNLELGTCVVNVGKGEMYFLLCPDCYEETSKRVAELYG
jgi:hypothetical protein